MNIDWRDAAAYAYMDDLDPGDLAWECLRRNPDYRREYPAMCDGTLSSQTWGLRFPGGSRAPSTRGTGCLERC